MMVRLSVLAFAISAGLPYEIAGGQCLFNSLVRPSLVPVPRVPLALSRLGAAPPIRCALQANGSKQVLAVLSASAVHAHAFGAMLGACLSHRFPLRFNADSCPNFTELAP